MNIVIKAFILICFTLSTFSQTPKPSISAGRNLVNFDQSTRTYIFSFNGESDIQYKYSLDNGGYFRGLTVQSQNYQFYPSYSGGLHFSKGNYEINPWDNNVSFRLVSHNLNSGGKLSTSWIMTANTETGPLTYDYNLDLSISGRVLEIDIYGTNNNQENIVSQLLLDRSENVSNAHIIGVPYLTMFNILYSDHPNENNKLFTSMFLDWTAGNASMYLPRNLKASETSVFYTHWGIYNKKTDGKRNNLREKIYVTVSSEIDDVFPNIASPVSEYRQTSVNSIMYDLWNGDDNVFSTDNTNGLSNSLNVFNSTGIKNLWILIHQWQKYGYDCRYPETFPPSERLGGLNNLVQTINNAKAKGYIVGVHENYVPYMKSAEGFSNDLIIKTPENKLFSVGTMCNEPAYMIKPTKYVTVLNNFSRQIHNGLGTNSVFLDVHTSYDPSYYVDYDSRESGAGKFVTVLRANQQLGIEARRINGGPVSGEGHSHFLYGGYYDDYAAQIHTGQSLSGWPYGNPEYSENYGGYYKPLLVNFAVKKINPKVFSHGVGYYERFYYKCEEGDWLKCYGKFGRNEDSVMIYAATTLAYGNGAFVNTGSYGEVYDQKKQIELQNKLVYPVQLLYGNANVVSIRFNDNGEMISASEYIKRHPTSFTWRHDRNDQSDFMSQIRIEYDNGLVVYVNRNPNKIWKVNLNKSGWYSYNAITDDQIEKFSGNKTGGNFTLPSLQGFLCYSPNAPVIPNQ